MKILKRTMICKAGDIIVIPFPFVDSMHTKPRPALVLSGGSFNKLNNHTICAMITTGTSTQWPSDIAISKLKATGLQVASVIRPKLFTLDNTLIKKVIGALVKADQKIVDEQLQNWLT
jgi:mRNA interferase MazF